jgi:hypothetical protein
LVPLPLEFRYEFGVHENVSIGENQCIDRHSGLFVILDVFGTKSFTEFHDFFRKKCEIEDPWEKIRFFREETALLGRLSNRRPFERKQYRPLPWSMIRFRTAIEEERSPWLRRDNRPGKR